MKLVYWAILGLALFIAVWFLVVVPAERRHHERKLALVRKRIERRQSAPDAEEQAPEVQAGEE